ncbi:MAG: hypothetical protein ACI9Y7_002129 [Dokdonia sp.]|jgi:hypothetical protein
MNRLIASTILCFLLLSCNSDDDTNSSFVGQTYVITSYLLDTTMDFNGDGISSNDLLIETPLFTTELQLEVFNSCLDIESLRFEDEGVACPFGGELFLDVEEDDNGQFIQTVICTVLNCLGFTGYSIYGDTIVFSVDGEIIKEGTFLNNTMTFTFSPNEINSFEFLQNDGTILTYNGSVTIIYSLE